MGAGHLDVVVGVPAGEARVGHAARPRADEGGEGEVAAVEGAGGVALGVVEVGGDAVEGVADDGDVLDPRKGRGDYVTAHPPLVGDECVVKVLEECFLNCSWPCPEWHQGSRRDPTGPPKVDGAEIQRRAL